MEFVVGTYEELLLGFKLVENQDGKKFEASFSDHSHTGCVKAVAVSPRGILASGSSDESIRLINLRSRAELGSLMHHKGSITDLVFFSRTHMFSSSEDGTIGVWRVGKWECLRNLRGHKGPVYSMAVHPSGKMALSVSRDKTLRTWNLLTGKCAYVTNIKQVADLVEWSPEGNMYAIVNNNKVDFYLVETGAICQTLTCSSRIYTLNFLKENMVVISGEGGEVQIYNTTDQAVEFKFSTDTNRVRGLVQCKSEKQNNFSLTTASSDGQLKFWHIVHKKGSWSSHLEASIDTKFRLTCLAVAPEETLNGSLNVSGAAAPDVQPIDVKKEPSSEEDEDSEPETPVEKKPNSKQPVEGNGQSKQKRNLKRKQSKEKLKSKKKMKK